MAASTEKDTDLQTSSGVLASITEKYAESTADSGHKTHSSAGTMGTCIYLGSLKLGFFTYEMEILNWTWWHVRFNPNI